MISLMKKMPESDHELIWNALLRGMDIPNDVRKLIDSIVKDYKITYITISKIE